MEDLCRIVETGLKLTEEQLRKIITIEFHHAYSKYLSNKKQKHHIYMVTFTIKPGVKEEAYDSAEDLVRATAKREALKIIRYEYVKEYTKAGIPHWHALVVTTKPLKKDRFNYYIKTFGSIDISKNKAQQTSEIVNYISKIALPIVLI